MAKPTINDVARLAGVSKKTVSRVINQSPLLNETTRARIEKIIAEIGYAPDPQARALALRRRAGREPSASSGPENPPDAPGLQQVSEPHSRRMLLALAYDGAAAPILADVQHGMLTAISGTPYALAVCAIDGNGSKPGAEFRSFLEQQRPAGVLLLPPLSEIGALTRLCRELGCSHVCLGAAGPDDQAELIASADRGAAAQAVTHLISLGHERIGMVTGPEDSRIAQERELGYLDAMADHDLDRGPTLIANGDHTFQSGLAAGQLLLEVSPRPTAIFAGNDEMAAGILHAAAQKGIRVPAGLSVVGFEDTAIATRLYPQLTTMRVPLAAMARAAALELIGLPASDSRPSTFTPELIARASTGPAPT